MKQLLNLILLHITTLGILYFSANAYAQDPTGICDIGDLSEDVIDADINYIVSDHGLAETHDDRYVTDSWCHSSRQVVRDRYWNDFGFYKRWWNDGFGYNEPCNSKLPLARAMNAIRMIEVANAFGVKLANDSSKSYYSWMSNSSIGTNKIKRLRAKCNSTAWPGAISGAWFATRTVYMYLKGFYFEARNSVIRASTLIHERAHLAGKNHNGDENSARCDGARCDKSWEYQGPFFYQVSFLHDFYIKQPVKQIGCYWDEGSTPDSRTSCQYLTELQLDQLELRMIDLVDRRFEEDPQFQFPIRNRGWVFCEDFQTCLF